MVNVHQYEDDNLNKIFLGDTLLALLRFALHLVGTLFDLGRGIFLRLVGFRRAPAEPRIALLLGLLGGLLCLVLQTSG